MGVGPKPVRASQQELLRNFGFYTHRFFVHIADRLPSRQLRRNRTRLDGHVGTWSAVCLRLYGLALMEPVMTEVVAQYPGFHALLIVEPRPPSAGGSLAHPAGLIAMGRDVRHDDWCLDVSVLVSRRSCA